MTNDRSRGGAAGDVAAERALLGVLLVDAGEQHVVAAEAVRADNPEPSRRAEAYCSACRHARAEAQTPDGGQLA
jgi:hypothetical protein